MTNATLGVFENVGYVRGSRYRGNLEGLSSRDTLGKLVTPLFSRSKQQQPLGLDHPTICLSYIGCCPHTPCTSHDMLSIGFRARVGSWLREPRATSVVRIMLIFNVAVRWREGVPLLLLLFGTMPEQSVVSLVQHRTHLAPHTLAIVGIRYTSLASRVH